jgi:[acyl-carrier-protein] S-malonyltransferase
LIGLLCPGQGSQFVGMGRDLAEQLPLARETFEEADETLGFALSKICWQGTEEELRQTVNAQPAILVHTIAVWRVLQNQTNVEVALAAGHSLGEFSAYVAAGSIGFVDAVRLVRRRGELMFQAGAQRRGVMAAVLGLEDAAAEEVCRRASLDTGGVVVPANYNSPGQIVISGEPEAVQRAAELAKDAGGKRTIPLNVSGAFHSPLMEPAVNGLRREIDRVRIADPAFPVVSNVTAEPNSSAADVPRLLERQLTGSVRWSASVRTMIARGITEFLEIGPGDVLSGLARRVDRSVSTRPLGTPLQLDALLKEATWN